MRTLAIDTATEACSVALFDDGELVSGECRMLGRGHAEQLVPMISALPGKGRADRIAVSLGPGSFTGVRVGVAVARALAFAWNSQLLGYPTLAFVAAIARAEAGAIPVAVAMTGGHGEWFVESFDENGSTVLPLASMRPEDAATGLAELNVAGTQAETLVERRGSGIAHLVWPDARLFPSLPAHSLMESTSPLYGRPPDAKVREVKAG